MGLLLAACWDVWMAAWTVYHLVEQTGKDLAALLACYSAVLRGFLRAVHLACRMAALKVYCWAGMMGSKTAAHWALWLVARLADAMVG